MPQIVKLLSHSKTCVVKIAISTLDMMCSGSNEQKQILLDSNIISCLSKLFRHKFKYIRNVATFCISKIAAGCHEQKKAVIGSIFFATVIECVAKNEPTVQIQAMSVIDALLMSASENVVERLIQAGLIIAVFKFAKCDQQGFADVSYHILIERTKYTLNICTNFFADRS